jgi:putative endonuclease
VLDARDSAHAVCEQTELLSELLCISAGQPPIRNALFGCDLRRVHEHKTKAVRGFTARYGVDRLVWYETYDEPIPAIAREKELKKWRRDWKIRLIEEQNPNWHDLYQTIAS